MKIKLFLAFLTLSVSLCAQINTGGSSSTPCTGCLTGVNGTANQVSSDAGSPTTTLSIPSTFIAPGSIQATTSVTSGANGGAAGVLNLNGSTSGTASCTAPAIAGTSTNQVVCTNVFGLPTGTQGAPAFSSSAQPTAGWYFTGTNITYSAGNTDTVSITGVPSFRGASNFIYSWGSTTSATAADTGVSRVSAGVVGAGTGASGSTAGKFSATGYFTPSVLVSSNASATTAATTLVTPAANATYMAIANVTCLSGTGTVTIKITYTDTSSTAQTIQPSAAACSALGSGSVAMINSPIRAKSGVAIQVTATLSGTASYDLSAEAPQITSN